MLSINGYNIMELLELTHKMEALFFRNFSPWSSKKSYFMRQSLIGIFQRLAESNERLNKIEDSDKKFEILYPPTLPTLNPEQPTQSWRVVEIFNSTIDKFNEEKGKKTTFQPKTTEKTRTTLRTTTYFNYLLPTRGENHFEKFKEEFMKTLPETTIKTTEKPQRTKLIENIPTSTISTTRSRF